MQIVGKLPKIEKLDLKYSLTSHNRVLIFFADEIFNFANSFILGEGMAMSDLTKSKEPHGGPQTVLVSLTPPENAEDREIAENVNSPITQPLIDTAVPK